MVDEVVVDVDVVVVDVVEVIMGRVVVGGGLVVVVVGIGVVAVVSVSRVRLNAHRPASTNVTPIATHRQFDRLDIQPRQMGPDRWGARTAGSKQGPGKEAPTRTPSSSAFIGAVLRNLEGEGLRAPAFQVVGSLRNGVSVASGFGCHEPIRPRSLSPRQQS
jgi:hypothetical protein